LGSVNTIIKQASFLLWICDVTKMNEVKKVIVRMAYVTKHNVIMSVFMQTLGSMKFSQHAHT